MNVELAHIDLTLRRHGLDRPVGGSGVASVDVLVAEMVTRDGVAALGFSYALASSAVPAFHAACEIAQSLVAAGPLTGTPDAHWQAIARCFNRTGKGPNFLALAAIDVALWDLEAKAHEQALWRCFGDVRPRVPLYQSAGFGAADTPEQTTRRVAEAIDDGYAAVKLRVAGTPADVARVEAACGRGARVMVDVNEKGRWPAFAEFAAAVRSLPLEWIEEPFPSGELRSYRRLAAASSVPLAAGEHLQGLSELLPFLDEPLLAVVQPDLAMMGGLSECLRVAHETSAAGRTWAPHFLPGLFVHLGAAAPNLVWLEEFPLLEPLFDGWPAASTDRHLSPTAEPGHGLRLSAIGRASRVLHQARFS